MNSCHMNFVYSHRLKQIRLEAELDREKEGPASKTREDARTHAARVCAVLVAAVAFGAEELKIPKTFLPDCEAAIRKIETRHRYEKTYEAAVVLEGELPPLELAKKLHARAATFVLLSLGIEVSFRQYGILYAEGVNLDDL